MMQMRRFGSEVAMVINLNSSWKGQSAMTKQIFTAKVTSKNEKGAFVTYHEVDSTVDFRGIMPLNECPGATKADKQQWLAALQPDKDDVLLDVTPLKDRKLVELDGISYTIVSHSKVHGPDKAALAAEWEMRFALALEIFEQNIPVAGYISRIAEDYDYAEVTYQHKGVDLKAILHCLSIRVVLINPSASEDERRHEHRAALKQLIDSGTLAVKQLEPIRNGGRVRIEVVPV